MLHLKNEIIEALISRVVSNKTSKKHPEIAECTRKEAFVSLTALYFLFSARKGNLSHTNMNTFHRRFQGVLWERIAKSQRCTKGIEDGVTFQNVRRGCDLIKTLGLITEQKHDYVIPTEHVLTCSTYNDAMRNIVQGKQPLAA